MSGSTDVTANIVNVNTGKVGNSILTLVTKLFRYLGKVGYSQYVKQHFLLYGTLSKNFLEWTLY